MIWLPSSWNSTLVLIFPVCIVFLLQLPIDSLFVFTLWFLYILPLLGVWLSLSLSIDNRSVSYSYSKRSMVMDGGFRLDRLDFWIWEGY
jgi:hypothetical protein